MAYKYEYVQLEEILSLQELYSIKIKNGYRKSLCYRCLIIRF